MLANIEFEGSQQTLSKTDHKRGQYKKFTDEDRFETRKYAAIHGPSSSVKKIQELTSTFKRKIISVKIT